MSTHWNLARTLALLACLSLLLVGCMGDDEDDNVADQIEQDVIGSPTAAAGLEQDIDEISVEITDESFSSDRIELTQDRATVLTVQNNDDVAYIVRIGDLVTGEAVPAGETVQIEFTTPQSDSYEAELLAESGDDALDTMTVDVADATGRP